MEHALTRLLTDVGDNAVALHPLLLRQLGDDLKDVGHDAAIVSVHLGYRADVSLGDHQEMGGCLGRDIIERVADVVLIALGGRDLPRRDLADSEIGHGANLPL